MASQVERLLADLSSPETRAALDEDRKTAAYRLMAKADAVTPFLVNPKQSTDLEILGIASNPFSTQLHTHAADKNLENDSLNTIGLMLPKDPVTLIQIKRAKLRLLHRAADGDDKIVNYVKEPRDLQRFQDAIPAHTPKVNTQVAVLHDTLHFLSPRQLYQLFAINPHLETLYATCVLPIEVNHRMASLYPSIYTLEYRDDGFLYIPGTHAGGAYWHSYDTMRWLSICGIKDVVISRHETKAAHHIFVISRYRSRFRLDPPREWLFHCSEHVRVSPIFFPGRCNSTKVYSVSFIKRMIMYCKSVKAVAMRDIFAKMRQVLETKELLHYNMADLVCLANYLLMVTAFDDKTDGWEKVTATAMRRLMMYCSEAIREFLRPITGSSRHAALLSVIEPIPVHFSTRPQHLHRLSGWAWEKEEMSHDQADLPVVNALTPDLDTFLDAFDEEDDDGSFEISLDECFPPVTPPPSSPNSEAPASTREEAIRDEIERVIRGEPQESEMGNPSTSTSGREDSVPTEGPSMPLDLLGSCEPTPPAPTLTPTPRTEIQFGSMNNDHEASSSTTVPATPSRRAIASSHISTRDMDILQKHGFTNFQKQSDGFNTIAPILWNPTVRDVAFAQPEGGTLLNALLECLKALHRVPYHYQVRNSLASDFASDIKNGRFGVVLKKLPQSRLESIQGICSASKTKTAVVVVHGAGGAGKSRSLQECLLANLTPANTRELLIVLPTNNLVNDWREKVPKADARRITTYEKACKRDSSEVVIMDDYGKLPPGFVDFYLALKSNVKLLILTGDQRQSTCFIGNSEALLSSVDNLIKQFSPFCDYYVNATHRQPRRLANPLGVHAQKTSGGSVKISNLVPKNSTVLVPSFKEKESLGEQGRLSYTYAGCQGLTVPHTTIVLDHCSTLCSEEVLYTALSRASESITFVNTYSDDAGFQAKLDSLPYLKTMLSGVREDERAGAEERCPEPEVREPLTKTHLPVVNPNVHFEPLIEACEDKDTRELVGTLGKTNLAQTEDPVIQLFPHQQAKDEPLYEKTIEARISTNSPDGNERDIKRLIVSGNFLFEAYADFMKVPQEPQPFNRTLWLQCRQKAERTYLSKTAQQLKNGATRQDPDFSDNQIALFNKSQWVKKLEKVGMKFKPGQTISAFKQTVVLLTTTFALYMRAVRETHQPKNVFIMCEKSPGQFDDFVKERWHFDRDNYTSDYSQYDQSQDAAFLNFELRKARHFGVPDEVCLFYRWLKCNAKTFVGNLSIMRLSGEGPTFDANTECNIAYDALRFSLTDTNACYAGDDLVRDRVCPERKSWAHISKDFKLAAKPVVTRKPDFCGWRLTPYGIIKNPVQLYNSMQLGLRLGKIKEILPSYKLDFVYAFRLQDKLFDIFDEEEMDAHQLTVRTMHKMGMSIETGDHIPVHHVVSDRILNPDGEVRYYNKDKAEMTLVQKEVTDSWLELREDYFRS
uniref:Replicase n=1 Tax=Saffron-associated alphaflexivirus TaxID=3125858 RepID=A0AAU6NEM5_9VIRU